MAGTAAAEAHVPAGDQAEKQLAGSGDLTVEEKSDQFVVPVEFADQHTGQLVEQCWVGMQHVESADLTVEEKSDRVVTQTELAG